MAASVSGELSRNVQKNAVEVRKSEPDNVTTQHLLTMEEIALENQLNRWFAI